MSGQIFRGRLWLRLALLFVVGAAGLSAAARGAVASPSPFTLQGLGKGTIVLDGDWQFHVGDDPAWASPALDDSQWERLSADQPWGSQTHFAYTGFGWYRRHLSFVPGAGDETEWSLLVPRINDAYEVYWNGRLIGGLGKLPPHPYWYASLPPQIYSLGRPQSGLLAFRVWKAPSVSSDSGEAGGFNAPPMVGSPASIANYLDARAYKRLRMVGFRFAITLIYGILAVLALLSWWRNRDRHVLLWTAVWALSLMSSVVITSLGFHVTATMSNSLQQVALSLADISIWYLLLYLLELDRHRNLRRWTFALACVSLFCGTSDGLLLLLNWTGPHVTLLQVADAVLTIPTMLIETFPLVLIGFAIGKRLDTARWLVAISAALTQLTIGFQNLTGQGERFTHWTIAETMNRPLFTLGGNPFPLQSLDFLFLLFAIIYAVFRYSAVQSEHQAAMEQEFRSAQELQQVLIPETLPPLPGYATTSAYRPAQQVGGDFFQLIAQPDGSALLILGDVSGKGLKAAMTVSLIVGAIRTIAETSDDPAELLAILNRRLHGRLQNGFVTCTALRLDAEGRCVLANAGHPSPFLNRHELSLPGALPLGLDKSAQYEKVALKLTVGDRLTLYTDGLLEARNAAGELFSFDRLQSLIETLPDAKTATEAAVTFGQEDDITVITITRLAQGEQATTTLMSPELVGVNA